MNDKSNNNISNATLIKSNTRLIAVQLFYSNEITNEEIKVDDLTNEVLSYYNDDQQEDSSLHQSNCLNNDETKSINKKFLDLLVNKAKENQTLIDKMITDHLTDGWAINKLASVIRSLLRLAVAELTAIHTTPARVIINEYVSIAKMFHGENEVGFVNGILQKIANKTRPEEFSN
jgi:N utilization substance protein B